MAPAAIAGVGEPQALRQPQCVAVRSPAGCGVRFRVVGENFLKTAPKGFPKDYPYLKYLQCKEYTVACSQPDSFFLAPDFLDRTDDIFKQMKRFSDFVNYTIDDFE